MPAHAILVRAERGNVMSMTYEELLEKVRAAWESRIILSAVELGVADALSDAELTASEVADRLGTNVRATDLLLNAMVALGLAEKHDERFANSTLASEHLVKGSRNYRGAGLRHHANIWKSWSGLTEVVRSGKPSASELARPDDEYHDFVRAMYDFSWERTHLLAEAVDLSGVESMLDLGGGPGSYAIAFCARNPKMRAIVFDKQPALEVANEIVKKHGAEQRVSLKAGDFFTDDLGAGYDLVLISQIIHSYGEKENRLILEKAWGSLVDNGLLILQDFLLAEERTSPTNAAVFAINMLVNTEGGRTYTWREVESWLKETGFIDVEKKEIPGPAGVIVARKAAG